MLSQAHTAERVSHYYRKHATWPWKQASRQLLRAAITGFILCNRAPPPGRHRAYGVHGDHAVKAVHSNESLNHAAAQRTKSHAHSFSDTSHAQACSACQDGAQLACFTPASSPCTERRQGMAPKGQERRLGTTATMCLQRTGTWHTSLCARSCSSSCKPDSEPKTQGEEGHHQRPGMLR